MKNIKFQQQDKPIIEAVFLRYSIYCELERMQKRSSEKWTRTINSLILKTFEKSDAAYFKKDKSDESTSSFYLYYLSCCNCSPSNLLINAFENKKLFTEINNFCQFPISIKEQQQKIIAARVFNTIFCGVDSSHVLLRQIGKQSFVDFKLACQGVFAEDSNYEMCKEEFLKNNERYR